MKFETHGERWGIATQEEWDQYESDTLAKFNQLLSNYVGGNGDYEINLEKGNPFVFPGMTVEECLQECLDQTLFNRTDEDPDERHKLYRKEAFWFDALVKYPWINDFRRGWEECYHWTTSGIAELEKQNKDMVVLREAVAAEYGVNLCDLHVEIMGCEIEDEDYERMLSCLDAQPLVIMQKLAADQKATKYPPFTSGTVNRAD